MAGVTVDFNANTAKFSEGVNRASGNLNKFKDEAERAGKAIGVAIAAAAAATAYLVKQSIDNADAMSKMAQSTGIAIDKLSGLNYAARLSGVETEALGSAMVKLTKGMADASVGTGEAMRGYEALGINIKGASGNLRNADEVMGEVADRFAGMADGANKTALAVAIFGKSGAAMIPLLNGGSAGLKEMHKEAEQLGLVLNEKTGKAAEQFNDNLTKLKASGEGFANHIMERLLPSLNYISGAMAEAAKNGGLFDAALAGLAATWNALFTDEALTRQQKIVKELDNLRKAMGDPNISSYGLNAINTRMLQLQKELAELQRQAADVPSDKKPEAPMMKSLEEINKAGKAAQVAAANFAKEELRRLEEFNRQLQTDAMRAQSIIADIDPIYKAGLAWDELATLVEKGLLTAEQAGAFYAKGFEADMNKMSEEAKKAAEKSQMAWERFTDNIQKNFGDVLFNGLSKGFKGIGDTFKDMINRMLADAAAANLTQALFGQEKGGGLLGQIGGSIGSFFAPSFAGGGFTGSGARSGGIDGIGGFPAILHPNETVIDHSQGQGGVTIVQNINIDSRSDAAVIITAMQLAKDMAKAEIMQSLQRGGAFATAVGRA